MGQALCKTVGTYLPTKVIVPAPQELGTGTSQRKIYKWPNAQCQCSMFGKYKSRPQRGTDTHQMEGLKLRLTVPGVIREVEQLKLPYVVRT